jgi:leucyl aminopeptidase
MPRLAACPIHLVSAPAYATWLAAQPAPLKRWLAASDFSPQPGAHMLLPATDGGLAGVLCITEEKPGIWSLAHLPAKLPGGHYRLEGKHNAKLLTQLVLGWELARYRFTRYRNKKTDALPTLEWPTACDKAYITALRDGVHWARDLINTPANDMHPAALAQEAASWARKRGGSVKVIKGEALLKANYPLIYTVGKAAEVPPHLVDIRFVRAQAPRVTLVGKGVCFDSGGLDIKSSPNMKYMKKDMGGAASVLALAHAIIETGLPVSLRVLLPIVENAISGNAMRPLDVVTSRKGISVEIGNTDAEGRLILCDALTEADDETPDLLIDCATLTGAARVALGTEIPALFTPDDALAAELARHSAEQADPLWRLPLWKPYRSMLETKNADISNDPDSGYGGAITAALYLQEFVGKTPAWLHIDMMAWNLADKPGRPKGGEAMAVRALYALIKERYGR